LALLLDGDTNPFLLFVLHAPVQIIEGNVQLLQIWPGIIDTLDHFLWFDGPRDTLSIQVGSSYRHHRLPIC